MLTPEEIHNLVPWIVAFIFLSPFFVVAIVTNLKDTPTEPVPPTKLTKEEFLRRREAREQR